MPQYHWRSTDQMRKKHTFQTKMAEEYQRIFIWFLHSVMMSFTYITMFGKKLIKLSCYIVIVSFGIRLLKSLVFIPVIILVKSLVLCPVLRKPVP